VNIIYRKVANLLYT